MKTITSCKKKGSSTEEGDAGRANQLNQFNPPPLHYHQGAGEQRAEEAAPRERGRPGQSVSKDAQGLFC